MEIKKIVGIGLIGIITSCSPYHPSRINQLNNVKGKSVYVENLGYGCDRFAIGTYLSLKNKEGWRLVHGKSDIGSHAWLEKWTGDYWSVYDKGNFYVPFSQTGYRRNYEVKLEWDNIENKYYKRYRWIGD